jgi:hypothetical protein
MTGAAAGTWIFPEKRGTEDSIPGFFPGIEAPVASIPGKILGFRALSR